MIPRIHIIIIALAVLCNAGLSAYIFPRLPDPCPIHWNIRGEVDGYGAPLTMALLGPSIAAGVALMMCGLPLLGPFRKNMESFRVVYGRIAVTLVVFFFGLQVVLLLAATGNKLRIGPSLCILFGILFAVLGNWMGKLRRNLYIGIRTPWTIANDVVWEKTHRLGGKLFVVAGFVSAITGVFASELGCFITMMSSIGIAVLWSVLYSLVEYRRLGQVDDFAPGQPTNDSHKGIS
jgi:uncharacterized membrane protein